jgi:hypothetical protein
MTKMFGVAVGLALLLLPAQTTVTGQQYMKYAFLLTIDSGDSRNSVIGTIRGNGSVLDLVEGRDQEGTGGDIVFNRYVLKPSLVTGGAEIPAEAWVGINAGVPAVVRNEYSQNSTLWRTVEFRGYTPAVDRTYMQARLRQFAAESGATHIWEIIPGQSLAGDLLSHFVPIF